MNPTLAFAQAAAYAVSFQQEILQCEIRHAVNALAPAALALSYLSKRTTWKCPFKAATYNGVPPGKQTIPTWPRWAAMNNLFYLAYLLAFYLAVEGQRCSLSSEGPRLRSSGAHWARRVPGWGPAVLAELGRSQVEVQRCLVRSDPCSWGPAAPEAEVVEAGGE